jgi:hypothetical protein
MDRRLLRLIVCASQRDHSRRSEDPAAVQNKPGHKVIHRHAESKEHNPYGIHHRVAQTDVRNHAAENCRADTVRWLSMSLHAGDTSVRIGERAGRNAETHVRLIPVLPRPIVPGTY